MKALLKIILVSAVLLAFPQNAKADYEDGQMLPETVIRPLMMWVEAQTGVRVPVMPKVVASHTRLSNIVNGMGRLSGRARAVYVGGIVILDSRYFDEEDTTQLSYLVHELVHYAQSYKRQNAWACAQGKEVEAYTLQNKWLEEQGSYPIVRASWIQRMASCPAPSSSIALAQAD